MKTNAKTKAKVNVKTKPKVNVKAKPKTKAKVNVKTKPKTKAKLDGFDEMVKWLSENEVGDDATFDDDATVILGARNKSDEVLTLLAEEYVDGGAKGKCTYFDPIREVKTTLSTIKMSDSQKVLVMQHEFETNALSLGDLQKSLDDSCKKKGKKKKGKKK